MKCHVILVGLPGAGKSAVGRIVAQMLDVEFFDIDELIERKEGISVAEIFTDRGEPEFRRLERLETEHALIQPFGVIAPGGGWAAEEDNLDILPDHVLTVYLETSAQTAAARVCKGHDRPLLNGPDTLLRITDLLTSRASFYEKCEATVSTDGRTVREVAEDIVKLARGAVGG